MTKNSASIKALFAKQAKQVLYQKLLEKSGLIATIATLYEPTTNGTSPFKFNVKNKGESNPYLLLSFQQKNPTRPPIGWEVRVFPKSNFEIKFFNEDGSVTTSSRPEDNQIAEEALTWMMDQDLINDRFLNAYSKELHKNFQNKPMSKLSLIAK